MLRKARNDHRFVGLLPCCPLVLGLMLCGLVSLVGCQSKDGISTYYTQTETSAASSTDATQKSANPTSVSKPPQATAPRKNQGKPTDRMIAAIVPTESQAWFLKVVGPRDQVDFAEDDIEKFFDQLKLEAGEPAWKLPEGWQEGPDKTMRLATLLIPTSDTEASKDETSDSEADASDSVEEEVEEEEAAASPQPLELSIIGLPLTGDRSSQILSNVNRWRGQLGRDSLTISLFEEMTTSLEIAEGAILFDSTGWFSDGGMSSRGGAPFAPFAGGDPLPKGVGLPKDRVQPSAKSPAAPSMANAPAVPVGSGELKQTPPEGWTNLPGSAMRKASLSTPDGATVTAFVFPATAPAMADPLANVNRWRGEVGLGPTTNDALAKSSKQLELAGGKATYVELVGETETTLAAMTPRGDQVWFFKLRGPNAAAESQTEAFKQWLASIEL